MTLLDQARRDWGLPPGTVLADEAYGGSFAWRAALRERDLFYCVRVPWTTTAWQQEPRFGEPAPGRRGFRARRGPLLSPAPKDLLAIARELPAAAWKTVAWRQGTKGPPRSRFASLSVWAAHGWKQGPQPARLEETVLIEWPEDEPAPTRYWLARTHKKKVALAKLVAMAKARWRVEQDYRELKGQSRAGPLRGPLLARLPPPRRLGHRRLRVPASGAKAASSPRAKKACRYPPCRRCAEVCKPPSSAWADAARGVTPASSSLPLPDEVLLGSSQRVRRSNRWLRP